jgi:FAD synthetase
MLILILACLPAIASSSDTKTAASPTAPKTTTTNGSLPSASEPHSLPSLSSRPLQGVYVVSQHPFPEVEAFVTTSAIDYHLDLAHYALPMRPALEAYLGENKNVEAIFVGTRRTDPHGKFLTHFDLTDKDWPRFMRIHPVIDWHYSEIWTVSWLFSVPFTLFQKDKKARQCRQEGQ